MAMYAPLLFLTSEIVALRVLSTLQLVNSYKSTVEISKQVPRVSIPITEENARMRSI